MESKTTIEKPVIILRGRGQQSYDLHANSYITKPVHRDGFQQVLKAIEDFWLVTVKLPSR